MSKKAFVVILVLSVVVTYGVAIIDALIRNSLLAGEAGFPFRFSSSYFFGESTNFLMLILDIVFWFIIIWLIWKLLYKMFSK